MWWALYGRSWNRWGHDEIAGTDGLGDEIVNQGIQAGMWFLQKGKRATSKLLGRPYFATDDLVIGSGVQFGRNVRFHCKSVRLGDGVRIGDDVTVNAEHFEIGDYGTIYSGSFFPGPGRINIGHNFWLGRQSIVDCQGGTTIGNNVGIGGQSQLWTHMKFGDVLAGCRFHSSRELVIDDDAWLVGHVLVSPVHIGARSLVMLGSLVVTDIPADRTFAGVPAGDMTSKFGPQFKETSPEERLDYLRSKIEEFATVYNIEDIWRKVRLSDSHPTMSDESVLSINVVSRTYRKMGTPFEQQILRFLLPDAKFTPE